jgi:hypothetical protein
MIGFKFPLCLSQKSVKQELEGHWIREGVREWQETNGQKLSGEKLNRKARHN